jgi:hypothetical protein
MTDRQPHRRRKRTPFDPPVPVEISLHRQAAVRQSWANTVDRRARAMPGVEAMLATFVDQVPKEIIDPAERRARGIELRRAYFMNLSAKAAAAKRRKREADAARAEQLRRKREAS